MSLLQTPKPPAKPAPSEVHPAKEHAHALTEADLPRDLKQPHTLTVLLAALLFVALLGGLFVVGWFPHHHAEEQANSDAVDQTSGPPAVTVAAPKSEAASKDILLPCDVRANQQTPLFARTSGYLKQWLVDIGTRVKSGQLLAVIDAPDVDAQLAEAKAAIDQSRAAIVKDQADVQVAQTDYNRYLSAQKDNPGSVTQQDVDAKRDIFADAAATLEVGKANLTAATAAAQRLTVMQGFEQITAPFDGVITARNYDVGALITAAAGRELFDIADAQTLRVLVDVPQTYATGVHIGQKAFLKVRNYPQREFTGTVARQAGALNAATRTLPFELDFVNADESLYPGMYGQARLPVTEDRPILTIPSSALIFNASGLRIALVRDGKIHFQPVTVGRDLGTELEITQGLDKDDQVVSNPGERLAEGVSVQINVPATAPAK